MLSKRRGPYSIIFKNDFIQWLPDAGRFTFFERSQYIFCKLESNQL